MERQMSELRLFIFKKFDMATSQIFDCHVFAACSEKEALEKLDEEAAKLRRGERVEISNADGSITFGISFDEK
jgi:hypothetical protein